jgi:hypothetical protein
MLIIWGKRLYGAVDRVPGVLHVATSFGHAYYFPAIPGETYIVVEPREKGEQPKYIPIERNGKSVISAYLRALAVAAGIFLTFLGGIRFMMLYSTYGTSTNQLIAGSLIPLAGLACLVGVLISMKMSLADKDRAIQLARQAGIPLMDIYERYS